MKVYRQVHSEKTRQQKRNKRLSNKLRAIEYKGGRCLDCSGTFHPAAFDFHHLNPDEKDANIGNIINKYWNESVRIELDKCILLCSNCHRIRHYKTYAYVI